MDHESDTQVIPAQRQVDNLDLFVQMAEMKAELRALTTATDKSQVATDRNVERIEGESKKRDDDNAAAIGAIGATVADLRIQWARATAVGALIGGIVAATVGPVMSRVLGG